MRRTRAAVTCVTATLTVLTLTGSLTGAVPGASGAPGDGSGRSAARASARAADSYGHLRNILPPGSNGNVTAADLLALGGSRTATADSPPHFADQLEMYDKLTTLDPKSLTASDLDALYKEEGFTPDKVISTEKPRAGVTIQRDSYGVPFVTGQTFADTEYGAGYSAIEDRMFLMDVLRHTGAARMTEFLGDTPGDVAMDQKQLRLAYYTPKEAAAQVEIAAKRAGKDGPKFLAGVDGYIAGINAAQDALCPTPVAPSCPVEYAALQKNPTPWTRADVVYIASLVGGIFGKGGGAEVENAGWLQALTHKYGPVKARRIYDDLREKNDPAAPTTSTLTFPYEQGGIDPTKPGVALPDQRGRTAPGTGEILNRQAPAGTRSSGDRVRLPDGSVLDFSLEQDAMSNAILLDAKHSATGHPEVVFGPQTGYYTPQLLTEEVLKGPDMMSRGVSFAGTNLVVQLGRGLDYAWSATSSDSDLVDTVVERLCNADGSKATVTSTSYLVGKRCTPMQQDTHSETVLPNATAPGAPKTYDFLVLRTKHGIVQERTTVGGKPVAIVAQRSTYGHEVDSVIGFAELDDPGFVHDADSFQKAVSDIDFTFNWFYADNRDISYYSSGLLPIRSRLVDSDLPHWAGPRYDWQGWLPFGQHVHQTNPPTGYLVSWNNKPAPGFGAADDKWSFGPVYRSLALEDRLKAQLKGGHKPTIEDMVGVMSGAATADSRARYTLPWLLKVLGHDPRTKAARGLLATWLRHGTPRVDRDRSGSYGDQAAIAIFDAWWEHGRLGVAKEVLRGRLGKLVNQLPQKIDDHPRQGLGSSWNGVAWYGYVQKDLQQLLGKKVAQPYHESFCGRGVLKACRDHLSENLQHTVARLLKKQGVSQPSKLTYDKSQDDITSVTAGVVGVRPIDWQNRPTFQQVVQFTGHRPR